MKINNVESSQLKLGAILNYVLIFLNALVGLLYTPYMLRAMGQSEYGLYSLVASVIAYLTILDLGMGNAIVRYTAKYRAEGKREEQYEMFGMFFILYLAIGVIAIILGLTLYINVDTLFGNTMDANELGKARIMMLILTFNLAFTFPMSIFGSIITAYERFVFPRVLSIIRVVLNTIVMVVLLHLGYRAIAMVIVQTIFNVVTLILNFLYCTQKIKIKIYFRHFKWSFLKEVAIYSFWILLDVIIDKIYWGTGQLVLGAVSGTIAVSVFAVGIHLQGMYMQFSMAISSVFLPKVTAMVTKDCGTEKLSSLFIRTGRLQFIVLSFVLCGFIVFGKQFVVLWAGAEYHDAYIISLLFFIALLVPLMQNLGITILQAKNQMKFRSLLYLGIAIVAFVFEIILSKRMGSVGCALAVSVALFLGQGVLMNIYYSEKQKLDIVRFWKEIAKMSCLPVAITILSCVILRGCAIDTWSELLIAIFIFSLIYIPLFVKFSMNQEEIDLVFKSLIRVIKK